jgi:hypothetical protein
MKSYDSDEELERALFALPLEEPPADLRPSILAATIYRPPLPVKTWEVWVLGVVCALLVWALVLIVNGAAMPELSAFDSYVNEGLRLFAQPATLFWIALGGGAAVWISQLNLTMAPGVQQAPRR